MASSVTPRDFSEIRWRGNWIWVEASTPGSPFGGDNSPREEAHGLFRKSFTLEKAPERAPARITADSRYVLFANGQEVFRGPVRSQPRRMHYDLLDLAPYLKPGENTVAVYVKYYGSHKSFWMPAAANMTLGKSGVLVFEADLGQAGWLVSDATWKAHKSDAWTEMPAVGVAGGVPVEIFDARKFPHAWQEPGFDDGGWGDAAAVPSMHIGGFARTQPPTDPYGPLYPRPIARLSGALKTPQVIQYEALQGQVDSGLNNPAGRLAASLDLPVASPAREGRLPLSLEVPPGGALRLKLDIGVIVSGLVEFEVSAPAGTVFDLAYLEEPLKPAQGMFGPHAGTRYTARGANDRFQVFDSNGLRYIYLLVHGASSPVTLKQIGCRSRFTPGREKQASSATMKR
jgi:alpha-L-rhamnosidase